MITYSTAFCISTMKTFMNIYNQKCDENTYQIVNCNYEEKFVSFKQKGKSTLYYLEFIDMPMTAGGIELNPEVMFRSLHTDLVKEESDIHYTAIEMRKPEEVYNSGMLAATEEKLVFGLVKEPCFIKIDYDTFTESVTADDILKIIKNNKYIYNNLYKNIKKCISAILFKSDVINGGKGYRKKADIFCKMNWVDIEEEARKMYFKYNNLPEKSFKELAQERLKRMIEESKQRGGK